MKIFIYPNFKKEKSLRCARISSEILSGEGSDVLMEQKCRDIFGELENVSYKTLDECIAECDAVVVTGGDGTILRCSKHSAKYSKPILGINCGTLGFMTTLEYDDTDKLRLLCRGQYTVTERMMLSVTVKKENGEVITADALNDAVIVKAEDCKIADFEVTKSASMVSSLRADGVIFSTATGATAYSLSAGGPIIEPDMKCIEFSQICAHSLFARTIVFSPESEISVHCRCKHDSHTILTVDGAQIAKITDRDTVVIRKSELTTGIIDITGGSFFKTVNRKLMTPLKEN